MRLISYRHQGLTSYGVARGSGIVDCARLAGAPPTVKALLEAGAVDEVASLSAGRDPDVRIEDVEVLPPVLDAGKVLCTGLNYHTHREETDRPKVDYPTVFIRFADTHVGHGQPILRPPGNESLDYEGELAVVIGKPGLRVDLATAMDHVAGYSCYNDASVRDWQRHTSQWTPGKNFSATGGFGPWLVTADEIDDPGALELTTRVNGDVRQNASVSELIFSIPELIAYMSAFTALRPGDVIVTGTPGGVGAFRDPPLFLAPGDIVEVEISHVGLLRNRIDQGGAD